MNHVRQVELSGGRRWDWALLFGEVYVNHFPALWIAALVSSYLSRKRHCRLQDWQPLPYWERIQPRFDSRPCFFLHFMSALFPVDLETGAWMQFSIP